MNVAGMLYKLILGPLELLFDVIYTFALRMIHSEGLSLIFLSLAINLLVLPMYIRADMLQAEEAREAARLKPGIDRIKRAFKGDERFMILQTYYRQNNYKPYYALKGSISLLLQIPFFIAAYNYLSNLQIIQGVAFGPIQNLGAPDGLLKIGGTAVNVLPVMMTLINIVSGAIYTRGMPLKSKIQLYGMALIFLVLLYDSPSGLVFYWTLNNVFSLVKNVFNKLPDPRKAVRGLCSVLGIAVLILFLFVRPLDTTRRKFIAVLVCLVLQLPATMHLIKEKYGWPKVQPSVNTKTQNVIFYTACTLLTLLTGLLIPSDIIRISPSEFVDLQRFLAPVRYLLSPVLVAAGTFLLWCVIFYKMSSPQGRTRFSAVFAALAGIAIVDYMCFGKNYGNMSSRLQYDAPISVDFRQCLVNLAVVLAVVLVIFLIWKKKPTLVQSICLAGCIAIAGMTGMNIATISRETVSLKALANQYREERPVIPLDKDGKNVIVIMLDRAINGFVPFVMNEHSELMKQFDGFIYYPNTLSYGMHTNTGAPGLFGGYEYIPDGMSARPDELLMDKHNEALKIMPVIFRDNEYEVTVCDSPYGNYQNTTDLSIFDEYPEIHKYTSIGAFTENKVAVWAKNDHIRDRNFFCYSLFRVTPLLFQETVYNMGFYNEADAALDLKTGSEEISAAPDFMDSYLVLKNLPYMTEIHDEGSNTFLSLTNNTTHSMTWLDGPAYDPAISNASYEDTHPIRYAANGRELDLGSSDKMSRMHYQINMAAFIQLGNWFDFLRANGLYDNTRIILVSDHAYCLEVFGFDLTEKYGTGLTGRTYGETWWKTMSYNPLLMVKDFNARGFTTDDTFMTNADTPCIAFSGLIDKPINPFTGKIISDEVKQLPEQHLIETDYNIYNNNGNLFVDPIKISLVNQDINDIDNWIVDQ